MLEFKILGCGNSSGVPASGNYWGKCDPDEPRNRRMRPSLLIKSNIQNLVIDTGPDFSQQTTRENLQTLDGVLYTHSHGDHVHGIDDVKRYVMHSDKDTMPVYTNQETFDELKRRFYYLFEDGPVSIYKAMIDEYVLDPHYGQPYSIGDVSFIPFEQQHGPAVRSVGYRFDDVAYSTDMKSLPDASIDILRGVRTWIVDAAGYHQESNPVHANLQEIYALNKEIKAERVILTSLSLAMDYQTLVNELPDGYEPAYDGMTITQKNKSTLFLRYVYYFP